MWKGKIYSTLWHSKFLIETSIGIELITAAVVVVVVVTMMTTTIKMSHNYHLI
jgi:hypothetical protein